jgi:hypothetical protein
MRYEPLQQIWLCLMSQWAEYDCKNINFPRYGPPWRIWYSTVGHRTGFGSLCTLVHGYVLCAIVQDLVPHSEPNLSIGPHNEICLCTIGHGERFSYALWAKAPNLSPKHMTKIFFKPAFVFKEVVMLKSIQHKQL